MLRTANEDMIMWLYNVGILISILLFLITSCDNDSVPADPVQENSNYSANTEPVTISQEVTGAAPFSTDKTTDMAIIIKETTQREVEMTESLERLDHDRAAIESEKLSMQPSAAEKP